MKWFVVTALLLITLWSCEKENRKLEGHYRGTFQRFIPEQPIVPTTSNITILFAADKFSGTTNMPKYPAICSGTYEAANENLVVKNTCMFTADFDWTLIFNGTYQYRQTGDSLLIWKDYPGGSRDLYLLEKESL